MKTIAADAQRLEIELDRSAAVPLHQQLYTTLRERILSGYYPRGTPLPSSRALSRDLRLSRGTIVAAFDQLYAEGYVEGRHGSGTFVARTLELSPHVGMRPFAETPRSRRFHKPSAFAQRMLDWTNRVRNVRGTRLPGAVAPMQAPFHGMPDLASFPLDDWMRIYERRRRAPRAEVLAYCNPRGYLPLREAIAAHLNATRGMACSAEQIVTVSGRYQALDLIARLIVSPGDTAWIEEPDGSVATRERLLALGARVACVPVDAEGLDVAAGIAMAPGAAVAIVRPSSHHPLGTTMSVNRRIALLAWASTSGTWIVEDDFLADFCYESRPIASLQGIDRDGRVIYIGTFNQTLFPTFAIAYVVLPPQLVDVFAIAKTSTSTYPQVLEQAALADFIVEGHFAKHIRKMRQLYRRRRANLARLVERLAPFVEFPAGLGEPGTAVGYLRDGLDEAEVVARLAERGYQAWGLSTTYATERKRSGLILGYGGCDEALIAPAVEVLHDVLRELAAESGLRETRSSGPVRIASRSPQ